MKATCFNRDWMFRHGTSTLMEGFMPSGSSEPVRLPHDALISRPRSADAVEGGGMGYFKGENVEYSKTFTVPADEKDKVHYLYFDGVYMNATIILNDRYVAKHGNGYSPFTLKIDRYLNYDKENVLKVRVFGSAVPNARWYPGLGIYRGVKFMTAEWLHFRWQGLRVTTLSCDEEEAILSVEADIMNEGPAAKEGYVIYTIKDAAGNVVGETRNRFYVDANDEITTRQRFDIEKPALWGEDTPNLYTCEAKIITACECAKEIDAADTRFGIRVIQIDAKHGMRINGKSVKLKGGCIHHDNGMIGAVTVPDAEKRKVALMKAGGYNAVRTAHNPPSQALLDACDELGMYVMDEFTDVWPEVKATYDWGQFFEEEWEKDVEDVVRRDYNHPSVVMWSIGNEIPETGDPVSNTWGRKLVDKFHALDYTRPVSNGINVMMSCMHKMGDILHEVLGIDVKNGGINDLMSMNLGGDDSESGAGGLMKLFGASRIAAQATEEAADMLDLVGYNYTADLYAKEHEKHPERVFFGSETEPQDLDYNWSIVKRDDYVIGDFCWTGWDYLGEVGIGRIVAEEDEQAGNPFMAPYPWICAYDADFDLTGNRRCMSYWRDTVWTGRGHQPYIGVQNPKNYGKKQIVANWSFTDAKHSWTWPGYEGTKTAVEVYTDAEEVELFVNGASFGKKKVGIDRFGKNADRDTQFYVKWEAEYHPGCLEAVAYIGGEEVGRQMLKTAETPALCVKADKTCLKADSYDLAYVEIELVDANGTKDMSDVRCAKVTVDGAVLAGCGSADPMTEENYQTGEHKFYEGRILAIVRAGKEAGEAVVKVESEGLEPVEVKITIA